MEPSAQDIVTRMTQEMLAGPYAWADLWLRTTEELWQAWWADYLQIVEESGKLFVRPIPF